MKKILAIILVLTIQFTTVAEVYAIAPEAELNYNEALSMEAIYEAAKGMDIPYTWDGIPQGITMSEEYVIVSSYLENGCFLVFIDRFDYRVVAVAKISEANPSQDLQAHVGGVAYDSMSNSIFVSGKGKDILAIPMEIVEEMIAHHVTPQDNTFTITQEEYMHVSYQGDGDLLTPSCLTVHDGELYVGEFVLETHSMMRQYKIIEGEGNHITLHQSSENVILPSKVQGMTVIDDYLILSSSYGRKTNSKLYIGEVNENRYEQVAPSFAMPPMSQGIVLAEDELWIMFESSAEKYKYNARNVQEHIWSISISDIHH